MDDLSARLRAAFDGRYALRREVGRGGMAIVFLAEDRKHGRPVALKVLRPDLAAIIGADRFLEEIATTAKLQHPNILPLHDSGEADGFLYYVMPFVEGESLRDRLDRERELPVEEAVEIARDVAAALEHAHAHGVLHRDIKPSNILLQEGEALVADFGVALATRKAGGMSRLTETGLSVGTPHYMSPEQAAGDRKLDARSDVYSLGATTYEMLVGEPPHVATTPQAVVAKVLLDTPAPIRRSRPPVPANVEAAVAKALARSPADRFRTAAAFSDALVDPTFRLPITVGEDGEEADRGRVWTRLGPVLAVLLVAAGLGLGWIGLRSRRAEPVVSRYSLAFLPGQELVDQARPSFALGPEADVIVYVGPGAEGTQLWVKERSSLAARPLGGTDGATLPRISPDGSEVVYWVGAELRKVPTTGGASVTLADNVAAMGVTWMGDGSLVYSGLPGFRLRSIPTSGEGPPQAVWPEQPDNLSAVAPMALPDSRGLTFTLGNAGIGVLETWVLDLETGRAKRLLDGALVAFCLGGYLFFVREDGAVFAVSFDLDDLETVGEPVSVLQGVKVDDPGYPDLAVSGDGSVLMLQAVPETATPDREMVWVSRDGSVRQVDPAWRFSNARNSGWSLSPDGRRLAIGLRTPEGDDVWIKQLDDGPLLRLTYDPAEEARPTWLPGGQRVQYIFGNAGSGVHVRRADGTGEPSPVLVAGSSIWQTDVSRDGAWMVARTGGVPGQRDIVAYRLEGDTAEIPLVRTEYDEISPQLSPDGRWLAYVSSESGEWQIEVRPFPDVGAGRWVVSAGGGYGPRWAHDGRTLFYVSGDRELIAASVETEGGFRVTERRTLFRIPDDIGLQSLHFPFDVSPDDRRFMMERTIVGTEAGGRPPLVLVENWIEEVKARVRRR
ncbi:MAG: protein kinase [Gemmatimonadota bacterium]